MDEVQILLNQIEENPDLAREVDFMEKALDVDTKFICLDQTGSEELYKKYVNLKMQKLPQNSVTLSLEQRIQLSSLEKVLNELNNPKEAKQGKFKIPHKYLFELIRDIEVQPDSSKFINFDIYFLLDGNFPKEYGEGLQELYDDPDYVLGMHGSAIATSEINKVLEEGLKATMQGEGPGHLPSHVAYGRNLRFLSALSFNRNNPNYPETVFILQIPRQVFDSKNPLPLYGNTVPILNENAHILPEYMWGYTQRKSALDYDSTESQQFDRTLTRKTGKSIKYPYSFPGKNINKNSTKDACTFEFG